MKLITCQDNKLIDNIIHREDRHIVNKLIHNRYEDMIASYNEYYSKKYSCLFWAWYRINNIRADKINNVVIGNILDTMDMKNRLLCLIDVPNEELYYTDFYDWSSYLYDKYDSGLADYVPMDFSQDRNWDECITVQVVFGKLKVENIIEIYDSQMNKIYCKENNSLLEWGVKDNSYIDW